jgi:hypothetical protein
MSVNLTDHANITWSSTLTLPVSARPPGVFAWVKWDWELPPFYKPRSLWYPDDKLHNDSGYPQTCPLSPAAGDDNSVRLTEKLQWFWFRQMQVSAGYDMTPEELKAAWRGLTKSWTAFTNGRGTDVCRDYITPGNEGAELPLLFSLTCGGTVVELTNRTLYSRGYEVKALRVSDYELWKAWTYKDHPQYFTIATNATVVPYGNKWRVDPFHYLDWRTVAVPILSDSGVVYVDPARVRILGDNEPFPKPYYP